LTDLQYHAGVLQLFKIISCTHFQTTLVDILIPATTSTGSNKEHRAGVQLIGHLAYNLENLTILLQHVPTLWEAVLLIGERV
jgi:hypothetical protein